MRVPLMKKYEHARERKLGLTSIIKNTIVIDDESAQSPKQRQSRVSNANTTKKGTIGCNRKNNGKRRNQPGRISTADRRTSEQYQQDHAPKECCELRLPDKDGREHRTQCGNEGQEDENLNSRIKSLSRVG